MSLIFMELELNLVISRRSDQLAGWSGLARSTFIFAALHIRIGFALPLVTPVVIYEINKALARNGIFRFLFLLSCG